MPLPIKADSLAYWYLRFNGYLTIPNFIVHPEPSLAPNQRTDVDVLGVRFPYREELPEDTMVDDSQVVLSNTKPVVVIAEVKRNRCDLNGAWTRRQDQNIHRVLRAVGVYPLNEIDVAAERIYDDGRYENDRCLTTLLCFGEADNPRVSRRRPQVPQITWHQVCRFIFRRFTGHTESKRSHRQWGSEGIQLWETWANYNGDADSFRNQFDIR